MTKYVLSVAFSLFLAYSSYAQQPKVVLVPQSTYDSLTEQEKAQAKEYARQNGIRWRIVKDPKGAPKQ